MTLYPKADYRPLAEHQGQARMARHDIICLHTMVGSLKGTDRMFHENGWGGTESHFGVGGKWGDGNDGVVYQWQDTEFRADANLDGNDRIISIETGDNFPQDAADIEPWTPKQLEAIVAICVWACRKYNIPPVLIPDSKPSRRGIGYHRQGVQHSGGTHPAGFLQPGGEKWSTKVGKECPGPKRIAQIPGIVARVKATLAGQEEDDMPTVEQIVAGLKPVIQAEIKAEVAKVRGQLVDVLKNEPIALNKPTAAELVDNPKAVGSLASAAFFLGNIEGDQDNDRDTDRAARARLEAKVDKLLALATPDAPAAG